MSRTEPETRPRPDDPPELVAYTEQQRLRNLAPSTIAGRARLLRILADWLEVPLREATLSDLRRFVGRPRRVAPATHFSEISILKAFYSALLELGLIEKNPSEGLRCRRVRSPRNPIGLLSVRALLIEASATRGEHMPLSPALAVRDRASLELLFATGMRASEVCAARVVDLDLEGASILVRRAKRGQSRVIPLPASAVAALRRYLGEGRAELLRAEQDDQGQLFVSMHGEPLSRDALYQVVARAGKRCGVHAYPHVFRRTLATELTRRGVSLPVVQKLLGHAHLTTTAAYVNVDVVDMRAALDELDRQRPGSRTEGAAFLNLQNRLFTRWSFKAAA